MEVTLTLPFPPSVNHYWRHHVIGGRARVYISEEGKEFRRSVFILARGVETMTRRVAVTVTLHAPDKRARDIDNYDGKALFDALTHAGVWKDDNQIDERHTFRGQPVAGGRCVVQIREIDGEK